jgi:hypothetical protein
MGSITLPIIDHAFYDSKHFASFNENANQNGVQTSLSGPDDLLRVEFITPPVSPFPKVNDWVRVTNIDTQKSYLLQIQIYFAGELNDYYRFTFTAASVARTDLEAGMTVNVSDVGTVPPADQNMSLLLTAGSEFTFEAWPSIDEGKTLTISNLPNEGAPNATLHIAAELPSAPELMFTYLSLKTDLSLHFQQNSELHTITYAGEQSTLALQVAAEKTLKLHQCVVGPLTEIEAGAPLLRTSGAGTIQFESLNVLHPSAGRSLWRMEGNTSYIFTQLPIVSHVNGEKSMPAGLEIIGRTTDLSLQKHGQPNLSLDLNHDAHTYGTHVYWDNLKDLASRTNLFRSNFYWACNYMLKEGDFHVYLTRPNTEHPFPGSAFFCNANGQILPETAGDPAEILNVVVYRGQAVSSSMPDSHVKVGITLSATGHEFLPDLESTINTDDTFATRLFGYMSEAFSGSRTDSKTLSVTSKRSCVFPIYVGADATQPYIGDTDLEASLQSEYVTSSQADALVALPVFKYKIFDPKILNLRRQGDEHSPLYIGLSPPIQATINGMEWDYRSFWPAALRISHTDTENSLIKLVGDAEENTSSSITSTVSTADTEFNQTTVLRYPLDLEEESTGNGWDDQDGTRTLGITYTLVLRDTDIILGPVDNVSYTEVITLGNRTLNSILVKSLSDDYFESPQPDIAIQLNNVQFRMGEQQVSDNTITADFEFKLIVNDNGIDNEEQVNQIVDLVVDNEPEDFDVRIFSDAQRQQQLEHIEFTTLDTAYTVYGRCVLSQISQKFLGAFYDATIRVTARYPPHSSPDAALEAYTLQVSIPVELQIMLGTQTDGTLNTNMTLVSSEEQINAGIISKGDEGGMDIVMRLNATPPVNKDVMVNLVVEKSISDGQSFSLVAHHGFTLTDALQRQTKLTLPSDMRVWLDKDYIVRVLSYSFNDDTTELHGNSSSIISHFTEEDRVGVNVFVADLDTKWASVQAAAEGSGVQLMDAADETVENVEALVPITRELVSLEHAHARLPLRVSTDTVPHDSTQSDAVYPFKILYSFVNPQAPDQEGYNMDGFVKMYPQLIGGDEIENGKIVELDVIGEDGIGAAANRFADFSNVPDAVKLLHVFAEFTEVGNETSDYILFSGLKFKVAEVNLHGVPRQEGSPVSAQRIGPWLFSVDGTGNLVLSYLTSITESRKVGHFDRITHEYTVEEPNED